MEQKKTLWIVAAVGLFLCVVIGAAMILYSSPSRSVPATASVTPIRHQTPADTQAFPPVQDGQNTTQPADGQNKPSNVDQMTVISGTTNVYGVKTAPSAAGSTTTIDLNTLKSSPAVSGSSNITAENEAGAQAMAQAQQSYTAETPAASDVQPQPHKTVSPASNKPAAQVKTPAVKKAAPAPITPKYWVQAASFAAKKYADNARSVLDENRIPSEVFTYKDATGHTFYRVRIGPYTTKSEAEYWRSRIIQIAEFKDTQSYVTNSSAAAR